MHKQIDEFEPETLIGEAIKRADQLENNPDYEPITLIGKTQKQMNQVWDNPNVEAKTLAGKVIKQLIATDEPIKEGLTFDEISAAIEKGEYQPQDGETLEEHPDTN